MSLKRMEKHTPTEYAYISHMHIFAILQTADRKPFPVFH